MQRAGKRGSLRIAVVTETYPPEVNGVARTIHRMVQGLLGRGHRIDLFRPRQQGPALVRNGDLTQHLFAGMSIPFYPDLRIGMPAYPSLLRIWRKERPDIVHLITEGPLGLAGLLAARKLGIPVISDYRTNYQVYARHYRFGFVEDVAERYLRLFHNLTERTLCPTSELTGHLAARGFRNLTVVGRGVDTEVFSPMRRSAELRRRWGLGRDGRAVLYVGRIAPEKNVDLAVQAFRAQQKIDPKLRMVLVGDGPARARLERNNPDLVFAGMLRGQTLAEHYASGDLFLFPSTTETFGNVILEAMASRLAPVTFDYAAARENLTDGVSAALAPLDRPDLFVAKAEELAARRDLANDLRSKAFSIARSCSWERVIEKLELLYEEHSRPPSVADIQPRTEPAGRSARAALPGPVVASAR